MKPNAALLAYTLVAALPLGAQNLVPNPSFEEIDTCPQGTDLLGYQVGAEPTGWWRFSNTPDYFTACTGDTLNGVPGNLWGYQPAQDGQAYSGLYVLWPPDNFREMIGAQLLQPLIVGETYYASMYVSMAYGGYYNLNLACDHIGMLFTEVPFGNAWTWASYPIRNYAQVFSTNVITDTTNWTLVSGSFVADSAYEYIVLGNHFDDANTGTISIFPGASPVSYYWMDQVCVSPNPNDCATAEGIADPHTNTLQLYPNPATDHVVLTSTKPGSAFASVGLLDASGRSVPVHVERNAGRELAVRWAQPLAPGVYVLRAALKSGERFTERVVVH